MQDQDWGTIINSSLEDVAAIRATYSADFRCCEIHGAPKSPDGAMMSSRASFCLPNSRGYKATAHIWTRSPLIAIGPEYVNICINKDEKRTETRKTSEVP